MDKYEVLKQYFGYDAFRDGQEKMIDAITSGRDVLGIMPTGAGKSLCYQIPALMAGENGGITLVISPLISLMKDQVSALNQAGVHAAYLNSSLTPGQYYKALGYAREGRYPIIYVAPERLLTPEFLDFAVHAKIAMVAVDEAHCVSQWGQDFRPGYLKIEEFLCTLPKRPVVSAFTATATAEVRDDIIDLLKLQDPVVTTTGFDRPNLYFEVQSPKDKYAAVKTYIEEHAGQCGIVYCLTRKLVEEVTEKLMKDGFSVTRYHAGLSDSERKQNQEDFIFDRAQIMVATNAFGMGIDKPDVRFVIHYDMPKSLEGYYQETGRAGRDGREGICLAFYSRDDVRKLEKLMEWKPLAEQDIGRELLRATSNYAESTVCRRKLLLHYFGEEYNKENCENCDNCLHPQTKTDAREELLNVLLTVKLTKENFRDDYIKDVLHGRETEETFARHHDELETFGICEDEDDRTLNAVINQAELSGYLEKNVEDYGVLKLTEKGRRFIKKPTEFMVTKDNEFNEEETDAAIQEGGANAVDPALYQMLCDLRKELSAKLDIPPYVIFQDQSLEAMATIYPVTMDELQNIPGVGAGKAKRYGEEFCKLIKRHCEENEIERPEDLRVRTVANKSKMKVSIIQAIDRKVALDDIALSKGIEFGELLDEVEAIVYSGTKLNIDYFLEEIMDEDHLLDIYDYFKESTTDKIDDALDELGDDFTEEEVRLVRIKFISEMAN